MPPRPSARSRVAPFLVMDIVAEADRMARAGKPVLGLHVGEPGGGAPPGALAAVGQAIASGGLGYSDAAGLRPLREAIADLYRERHALRIDPRRIVVTAGASAALVLAFLSAFDAGQRIAFATPGYPCYPNTIAALGLTPCPIATTADCAFQPSPDDLRALPPDVRGLVVASPANPTGAVLDRPTLQALADAADRRGITIISDEIYHGITFGAPAPSILEVAPRAIVVNSFSKYFCMPGWRVGWLVLPATLVDPVLRLAQNLFIAASTPSQHAALGAFADRALLDRRVQSYRENRDILLTALRRAGIERVVIPDGAFYLWADTSGTGLPASTLCRRLLDDTGVAITPGIDFDPQRGERFVRLAYAGTSAIVAEAAARLEPWLARGTERARRIA